MKKEIYNIIKNKIPLVLKKNLSTSNIHKTLEKVRGKLNEEIVMRQIEIHHIRMENIQ